MPRPKKHAGYKVRNDDWHQTVLFEFVKDNPIPKSWGHSVRGRYDAAQWLVTAAIDPSFVADAGLERYCFSLFLKEPDYALALLTFARNKAASLHQIEKVATLLIDQAEQLPRTRSGKPATDKEIADFFEKQPDLKLKGLHPSVIGKARNLLAQQEKEREKTDSEIQSAYEAQYDCAADAYQKMTQTPEFRRWYGEMQRKEQVWRERPITMELLQARPKHRPGFSFVATPEENEDLESMYVSQYMRDGTEFRPHESPQEFTGWFEDDLKIPNKRRPRKAAGTPEKSFKHLG